jgi:septum formation topological specificity factor MinE
MDYIQYNKLRGELEDYFLTIIKDRFDNYISQNFQLVVTVDYETHLVIEDLLKNDGLDVYGMNANNTDFRLLLNFGSPYFDPVLLPFTRIEVILSSDGNYNAHLSSSNLNQLQVELVDDYNRYVKMTEDEVKESISFIKNTHLVLKLKEEY